MTSLTPAHLLNPSVHGTPPARTNAESQVEPSSKLSLSRPYSSVGRMTPDFSGVALKNALLAKVNFSGANKGTNFTDHKYAMLGVDPNAQELPENSGYPPSASYGRLPMIIRETENGGTFTIDPYSLNFQNHIITFNGVFNPQTAWEFMQQVDYLKEEILSERKKELGRELEPGEDIKDIEPGPRNEIKIYIDSPGGQIDSLKAMLDTLDNVKKSGIVVSTVCRGIAASCGSVLLAAGGTPGHRSITPLSRVMIHQALTGIPYNKVSEVLRSAEELRKYNELLISILAISALDGHIVQTKEKLAQYEAQKDGKIPQAQIDYQRNEIGRLQREKDRIQAMFDLIDQVQSLQVKREELEALDMGREAHVYIEQANQLADQTLAKLREESEQDLKARLEDKMKLHEGESALLEALQHQMDLLNRPNGYPTPISVTRKKIDDVTHHDRWLNAEEAIEYGLVDKIADR